MAVNVTVELAVTAAAVTVNVALVVPAPMVMDGGKVRLALFADIATSRLVCGAVLSVNVHVVVPGVCRIEGLHTRVGAFGFGPMFNVVATVVVPKVADRFAESLAALEAAVAINVADRFPAETTTEPGTVTFGLLDKSSTSTIPLCAALLRETVHVLEPPGATVPGLQFTETSTVWDVTVN